MDFNFKHTETGEVMVVSLSDKRIQNLLETELYEMIQECNCQPVGETNVVECGCIDYLEKFELLSRD